MEVISRQISYSLRFRCLALNSFLTIQPRLLRQTSRLLPKCTVESSQSDSESVNQSELEYRASFLSKHFYLPQKVMEDFLKSNFQVFSMSRNKFQSCSLLLSSYGITAKEMFTYPTVFRCSVSTLGKRMESMQRSGMQPKLSLVTLSSSKFKARMTRLQVDKDAELELKDHETLLSKLLVCSPEEAAAALKDRGWFRKSRLLTLKKNIQILKNYGVPSEAILERLYVLINSHKTLEEQLTILKREGVFYPDYPKAFMTLLQSDSGDFQKCLNSLLVDREILREANCNDKAEYIVKRLECTTEGLNYMLRQYRRLLTINVPKLKQNLDFLLNVCKLKSSDIMNNALVLGFGNNTLQERHKLLVDEQIPVTAAILKMSKRRFQQYVDQYYIK
ncbi:transcription termination factor, mitochondrial-like [Haliotis asinina]|uniref:transcription termination factor, mitochondrial-like n=1 Tax=Haliotis asinina TaxID=109174 RepID=UPI0035322A36